MEFHQAGPYPLLTVPLSLPLSPFLMLPEERGLCCCSQLHSQQVVPLGESGCVTGQATVRIVPCMGLLTPHSTAEDFQPLFPPSHITFLVLTQWGCPGPLQSPTLD